MSGSPLASMMCSFHPTSSVSRVEPSSDGSRWWYQAPGTCWSTRSPSSCRISSPAFSELRSPKSSCVHRTDGYASRQTTRAPSIPQRTAGAAHGRGPHQRLRALHNRAALRPRARMARRDKTLRAVNALTRLLCRGAYGLSRPDERRPHMSMSVRGRACTSSSTRSSMPPARSSPPPPAPTTSPPPSPPASAVDRSPSSTPSASPQDSPRGSVGLPSAGVRTH